MIGFALAMCLVFGPELAIGLFVMSLMLLAALWVIGSAIGLAINLLMLLPWHLIGDEMGMALVGGSLWLFGVYRMIETFRGE